jgi:hypothetical protein
MTYKEDLLRLHKAEIVALRGKVQELEAKLELFNQEQWKERQER